MVLDLKDDHKVFDGLEDITLEGDLVRGAYRSDIVSTEGAPSQGVYLHTDVEWQVPTPEIPTWPGGSIPRIGQAIVAAGRTYTILSVRQPFLGDYYGCTCRQAKLEDDLALCRKITRYPAIVVNDGDGSQVVYNAVADPAFTDIPANIQDITAEHGDSMGKRGFHRVFLITVAQEIDLEEGDVLKDDTLTMYDVVSWENRDRIDELSVIMARIRS